MTPTMIGVLGMGAMLLLMFARMPIGLAMALVGAAGIAVLNSPAAALNSLGSFPYSHAAVQAFAVIPLFVLMGNFAADRLPLALIRRLAALAFAALAIYVACQALGFVGGL